MITNNKNNSEEENLEKVLDFLANSPFVRGGITDGGIIKFIKTVSFDQRAEELHRILDKLINDGYVKFEDKKMDAVDTYGDVTKHVKRLYYITFDGKKYFQNKEGNKNVKGIKNVLIWIGVPSAIYYLIEIAKQLYHFCVKLK